MGAPSWGGKVDCVTGLEGLQAGHEKKKHVEMSPTTRPCPAQVESRGCQKGCQKLAGLRRTCSDLPSFLLALP